MKQIIPILLAGVCLTGCSALIPSDHRTQEAVKTAGELAATHSTEVRKAGQAPPVTINARGFSKVDAKFEAPKGPNLTEIKESDTQESSGKDSAFGSSSTVIPFVIKAAIGLGVAVGLVFLIKYLRKSSPAVDAMAGGADDLAAKFIRRLRERAAGTTDLNAKAALHEDIAHLEAERGKLAAQKAAQSTATK